MIVATSYEKARERAIAQSTLSEAYAPCIAVKAVHRFRFLAEEYPAGHPFPEGFYLAARLEQNGYRWKRYDEI